MEILNRVLLSFLVKEMVIVIVWRELQRHGCRILVGYMATVGGGV